MNNRHVIWKTHTVQTNSDIWCLCKAAGKSNPSRFLKSAGICNVRMAFLFYDEMLIGHVLVSNLDRLNCNSTSLVGPCHVHVSSSRGGSHPLQVMGVVLSTQLTWHSSKMDTGVLNSDLDMHAKYIWNFIGIFSNFQKSQGRLYLGLLLLEDFGPNVFEDLKILSLAM